MQELNDVKKAKKYSEAVYAVDMSKRRVKPYLIFPPLVKHTQNDFTKTITTTFRGPTGQFAKRLKLLDKKKLDAYQS